MDMRTVIPLQGLVHGGWGSLGDLCVCVYPDRGGTKKGRSPPRDEVGGLCMASEGQSFLAGLQEPSTGSRCRSLAVRSSGQASPSVAQTLSGLQVNTYVNVFTFMCFRTRSP